MPNKKVNVFENDGEYRVHPPLIECDFSTGDRLIVRNNTSEDLVLYFPKDTFSAADPTARPLDKGKKIDLGVVVTQGAGNSNAYPYQVIAPKSGKKAKGNSDPVLIIEN